MSSHSIGFKPTTIIKNMVNISTTGTILSLLVLLVFGGIGWTFVSVSGAITDTSKQVNVLTRDIIQMEHVNDQLLSNIAYAESLETVKQQAQTLGFVPTSPENIRYMKVSNLPPVVQHSVSDYQPLNEMGSKIESNWYDPIINWVAGYK